MSRHLAALAGAISFGSTLHMPSPATPTPGFLRLLHDRSLLLVAEATPI
jgi:hypothetical protein